MEYIDYWFHKQGIVSETEQVTKGVFRFHQSLLPCQVWHSLDPWRACTYKALYRRLLFFLFLSRSTYLYILFIRAILVTLPVSPLITFSRAQLAGQDSSTTTGKLRWLHPLSCNYIHYSNTTTFIISFTYFSNVSCFACIVSSFLFEL
jgi:hypothetical protein